MSKFQTAESGKCLKLQDYIGDGGGWVSTQIILTSIGY
jgi:hypothetical protein